MPHPSQYARGPFPTTRWTLVERAADHDESTKREALQELLYIYLPAIRNHLNFRKSFLPEEVDDLIQGFVTDQMIERNLLAKVDQKKGKFRSYLLTALKNFIINHVRHQSRRVPQNEPVAHLENVAEPACDSLQEHALDVEWARTVLYQALSEMKDECRASGKDVIWKIFEYRLLRPLLNGEQTPNYATIVERFRLKSSIQAANLLVTAKRTFARMLRTTVKQYARDAEDIEDEIEDLKQLLSQTKISPCVDDEILHQAEAMTLADIFHMGQRNELDWQLQDLVHLLEHLLLSDLFDEFAQLPDVVEGRATLPFEVEPDSLRTFRDLFTISNPPVPLLKLAKQHAKIQSQKQGGPLPDPIATVMYLASIVCARIRHNESLTQWDDSKVLESIQWALKQPWLTSDLSTLFKDSLHVYESGS